MRFPSFLLLLFCLLVASLLRAADGDPKNVQIFQRNAQGENKPIDMVGSSYPLQAIGFDANGILSPLDILTQDEWTAQLALLTTALGLKANVASPNLTGTPTAPTAPPGTNTTQVATTAFATVAVNTEAATRAAADVAEAAARAGADAAEAATRATIDANKADLFHTHVAAEIVDGGAVGLPLFRTQTAAAARALIGPFVVEDGDKGDITVSGTGATYSIDTNAVTLTKMATIPANRFLARYTQSTGIPQTGTFNLAQLGWNADSLEIQHLSASLVDSGQLGSLARLPSLSAARLLGRGTASGGIPEEIPLSSNFSLTGGSLNLEHVSGDLVDSGTIPYGRISAHVGDTVQAHSATLDELATGAINSMLSANGGITVGGAYIVPPVALGANSVIDVNKPYDVQQVSGSLIAFTFSTATHSPGRRFTRKILGDADGITARTITIPASNSDARGGASITTFLQAPAPEYSTLTWVDTGTAWDLYGDPGTSTGKYVIANGKTATINNSITLAGTDGTTLTFQGTGTVMNRDSTDSPTNKTFDSQATGNVLKWIDEIQFDAPDWVDGTGTTRSSTEGSTLGHGVFSNSADQAANYVVYRWRVPHDIDTSVAMSGAFSFRLAAGDTGKHRYVASMADVTTSASIDAPTFSNSVNLDFAGDASGASADLEQVAYTTLTSWAGSLTAGHLMLVKIARDGDDGTNDTSTQNSNDINWSMKFGRSQ